MEHGTVIWQQTRDCHSAMGIRKYIGILPEPKSGIPNRIPFLERIWYIATDYNDI